MSLLFNPEKCVIKFRKLYNCVENVKKLPNSRAMIEKRYTNVHIRVHQKSHGPRQNGATNRGRRVGDDCFAREEVPETEGGSGTPITILVIRGGE